MNKKSKSTELRNDDGMPILGWLVSWSTRGFSIERDALIKALSEVKIDAKIAREVIPKNACIRATRTAAKGATKFHRKVADQENTAKFVVASTEVTDTGDAGFSTDTRVDFDKSQRSITVKGEKKAEIEEAYKRNLETYAGDQFRSVVLRYVKRHCAAVTYLDTGSIYFIPVHYKTELDKLRDLFDLLKSRGASLSVKEEINTKQVRSVMWDLTVGEVTHQVQKMKEDFEALKDKNDDLKDSSIAVRIKKYGDLKLKVECYETALQGKAQDLKAELDALTKSVKGLLA